MQIAPSEDRRMIKKRPGLRANTLKGLSGIVVVPGTVVPWVDLVISGPVVVSIGKIVVLGTVVVPWADVVTSGVVSTDTVEVPGTVVVTGTVVVPGTVVDPWVDGVTSGAVVVFSVGCCCVVLELIVVVPTYAMQYKTVIILNNLHSKHLVKNIPLYYE